jgi:hypothetical protein
LDRCAEAQEQVQDIVAETNAQRPAAPGASPRA